MPIKDKIEELIESKIDNIWTCIPAIVHKVNASECTVDVQPKIRGLTSETEFTYPVIKNVPVMFPRGGSALILLPVARGDVVLLVFSKFEITSGFDNKELASKRTKRQFDFNDAVAIPGFTTRDESYTIPTNGNIKILATRIDLNE